MNEAHLPLASTTSDSTAGEAVDLADLIVDCTSSLRELLAAQPRTAVFISGGRVTVTEDDVPVSWRWEIDDLLIRAVITTPIPKGARAIGWEWLLDIAELAAICCRPVPLPSSVSHWVMSRQQARSRWRLPDEVETILRAMEASGRLCVRAEWDNPEMRHNWGRKTISGWDEEHAERGQVAATPSVSAP